MNYNNILSKLNRVSPSREGSLFNQLADVDADTQTSFLEDKINIAMSSKNASNLILETGTNKCHFSLFVKKCFNNINIVTFGKDTWSQNAVDILNHEFGNYIEFQLGDSQVTLSNYTPDHPIQFAWIDGGHAHTICMSDLINCDRLEIPFICVDDYNNLVNQPVDSFCNDYNYNLEEISTDPRGIAFLRRYE